MQTEGTPSFRGNFIMEAAFEMPLYSSECQPVMSNKQPEERQINSMLITFSEEFKIKKIQKK